VVLAASSAPKVIEDDYAKALAEAKKTKKLLFVDAWAPWCHTCVFMREHVEVEQDCISQREAGYAKVGRQVEAVERTWPR